MGLWSILCVTTDWLTIKKTEVRQSLFPFPNKGCFYVCSWDPKERKERVSPPPPPTPAIKLTLPDRYELSDVMLFYPTELWRMFVGNWGLFYKQSWQLACLFILVTGGLSKVVKTWVIEGGDVWACVWGVGKWLWRQLVKCLFSYGGPD